MRPDQDPFWASEWLVRLMLGGRGAGKTRGASEAVREAVCTGIVQPGQMVGLVGRTWDEAVNIMVRGTSGILAVGQPAERRTLAFAVTADIP